MNLTVDSVPVEWMGFGTCLRLGSQEVDSETEISTWEGRKKWLDRITDAMNMNSGKLWEMVRDRVAWCAAVCGVTKNKTRLGI